jgi:hypothetical protein
VIDQAHKPLPVSSDERAADTVSPVSGLAGRVEAALAEAQANLSLRAELEAFCRTPLEVATLDLLVTRGRIERSEAFPYYALVADIDCPIVDSAYIMGLITSEETAMLLAAYPVVKEKLTGGILLSRERREEAAGLGIAQEMREQLDAEYAARRAEDPDFDPWTHFDEAGRRHVQEVRAARRAQEPVEPETFPSPLRINKDLHLELNPDTDEPEEHDGAAFKFARELLDQAAEEQTTVFDVFTGGWWRGADETVTFTWEPAEEPSSKVHTEEFVIGVEVRANAETAQDAKEAAGDKPVFFSGFWMPVGEHSQPGFTSPAITKNEAPEASE